MVKQKIKTLQKLHKEGDKYKNNLNWPKWAEYLQGHEKECEIVNGIKNGYPLYMNETESESLSRKRYSWCRSWDDLHVILDTFIKDAKKGNIAPINKSPNYIISLFNITRIKCENDEEIIKERVIRNASFSKSGKQSLNETINKEKIAVKDLPNLQTFAELFIDKLYLAGRDMRDAFRQLSLIEHERLNVGYSVFGMHWIDNKQTFGLAGSPKACQTTTKAILWILDNKKLSPKEIHLKNNSEAYIDDFTLTAKSLLDIKRLEKLFDELCTELGIELKHSKSIHAQSKGTVYGIEWDLKNQTASIPRDKFEQLIKFINSAIKNKRITVRAMEALCGKIMHYAQLNKLAKVLCFRMIQFIYNNIRDKKMNKLKILSLSDEVIQDLKWWRLYAMHMKTVKISQILGINTGTVICYTDASDKGAGWYSNTGHWSFYEFDDETIKMPINLKELHTVFSMIKTMATEFSGKKIIIYIDNKTAVSCIIRKWSKSKLMMKIIYDLSLLMLRYKIQIHVEWISTCFNVLADTLSRFKIKEFHEWIRIFKLPLNESMTETELYTDFEFV